jgi:hypothetical protein
LSATTITTTSLYDILSEKLGREQAKNLVDYVDAKIDNSLEDKTKALATKDDISNLQRWMIGIFVTLALMIIGLYFRK